MNDILWPAMMVLCFLIGHAAVCLIGRAMDDGTSVPPPFPVLTDRGTNGEKGTLSMEKKTKRTEHILVCLSPSPSNRKVIAAAANMAAAFHAPLTALYVQPPDDASLSAGDRERLGENIRCAEHRGAQVTTVTGSNVALQIAEFAHVSGITKIVLGRSGARRRHLFAKPPLTEQLIVSAPDVDVYIIPDSSVDIRQQHERIRRFRSFRPTGRDALITLAVLAAATLLGLLFARLGFSEANIITVLILGVLIISAATVSPLYSAAASLAGVLVFNYFFIEPRFSFHTYETEYLVTFAIMLISSLITGTLANNLKKNALRAVHEAYRTKVLFDTNRLLQKAENENDALIITARQTVSLLGRRVVLYPAEGTDMIGKEISFGPEPSAPPEDGDGEAGRRIAEWVFQSRTSAGPNSEKFRRSACQYNAIRINDLCYGVIAVSLDAKPLEAFEYSVFLSILGECALTLRSLHDAAEKERAAAAARSEKLRSDLLRSVSHDIRTPLTSISGNASNLLSHYGQLDDATLMQIFSDIYDDSEWLIGLVENLLYLSRIENGQMDVHLSADVAADVIGEALKHIDRNAAKHTIVTEPGDDMLLVRMDTRLIMQVLINLINNAVKNTPPGSEIRIKCERAGDMALFTVSDNGPGIPDSVKPRIFEMFYTGENPVADGRRGMGLGLALCRSVVEAHGGTITLTDNVPSGCRFAFTLPIEEVDVDE